MKYIKRSIEDIVLQSEKTFKSILVTGARQTGKSTMLKELFPEKKYVPMDDPFVEEQAKEQPNMFMMLNPPPVIYDEVQRTPELFRYIKIKCDQSQERGLFCLSGSQPLGADGRRVGVFIRPGEHHRAFRLIHERNTRGCVSRAFCPYYGICAGEK